MMATQQRYALRCTALPGGRVWPPLSIVPFLAACDGVQSTLAPSGPHAAAIDAIAWTLYAGAAAILLLVIVLTAWAIVAPPRWLSDRRVILVGGIAFPTVTLTALLVYGLSVMHSLAPAATMATQTINVVGERWWWRVRYLGGNGDPLFETANEIRIPVGQPVKFVLSSPNVIHSFWVPRLGGKLDMIPGRTTTLVLSADEPGVYRGQCAEYCGQQHALMAFNVVAMEAGEYTLWLENERRAAAQPDGEFMIQGRDAFLTYGCGACHTVRGTPASGVIGPDLTHVGSRLTIGAATYPNNVGNLAAWIMGSQHLKPGNLMPSFDMIGSADVGAIAAYLESLK